MLDDPSPATERTMRAQLLRVQLVFQSGVGPVEVAERIQFRAVGLMSDEALQENPEEKMLRELRSSADHEEAMLDDPRNSVPSDAVSLAWVRDRVREIRSEDDRAVRAGKLEPDREQEIYEIENEFGQYGPPVGLSVSTLLGSAEARATRKKQLERDQKARHEMLTGRREFVVAAGKWLAEPPALNTPQAARPGVSGVRRRGRLSPSRSRS
ncbi:hypothetical protein [Streptomyces sp. NBC_00316]|uniref:hypothetical protein n=1 Tax=Streptomyces sp. NBC_00316 TaxID=2975710 RepID=UPI002E2C753D|nr:hypothetical protein [Streptomyces sp. NBC_00316]